MAPKRSCYVRAAREQNLTASLSMDQSIRTIWNQGWGMTSMLDGMPFPFAPSKNSLTSGKWALCFIWSWKCRSNFGTAFLSALQHRYPNGYNDCEGRLNSTKEIILETVKDSQHQRVERVLGRPGFLAQSNRESNSNSSSIVKCAFSISYPLALPLESPLCNISTKSIWVPH